MIRQNYILSDAESETIDSDLEVGRPRPHGLGLGGQARLAPRNNTNAVPDGGPGGSGLTVSKGSAIWEHFVKIDANKSRCNYCLREFATNFGTTSCITKHLEKKHAVQHANFLKEKKKRLEAAASKQTPSNRASACPRPTPGHQQTVVTAFNKQTKMAHDHPVAKKITRKIAEWIGTDLQPFSVVEERGFVQLMHEARPDYTIPSRTTFSRNVIPQLYADTQKSIQHQLTEYVGKARSMSFTSDIWTSRAIKSYISLTCHFMSENFEIVSYCLGNSHFPGAHTADAIFNKITGMMAQWDNLQELCSMMPMFFITDNAKNYVAAVRDSWEALSCFAHTLQLAISDAKKSNEPDVIKKVRSIVTHYNHSPKAYARLQEFQTQMNLPTHTLPQDVPTRWNSEHAMLKRVFEQKNAIAAELGSSTNRGTAELLSAAEWQVVDGLVKVLEPFAEATALTSGSVYPTRSLIIPLIIQLKAGLTAFIRNPANQGHGIVFARNLEKSLLARFPQFASNTIDCMSMMLDPRFKDRIFDTIAQKNNARMKFEREVAEAIIFQTCDEDVNRRPDVAVPQPQPSSSSLWATYDSRAVEETFDTNNTRQQEIMPYLSEPVVPRVCDPLLWWKNNQDRFPSLAKLAKCYLSIPATQVASERQFSAGSNTVTSRRERLTPLNVEMMVFLNQNLK